MVTKSSDREKEQSRLSLNYDLNERVSMRLPKELDEISGHTLLEGNDEVVYAIQDENGILYQFNVRTKQIERRITFGPDGDYEDIATDGHFFYVLLSNGDLYSFPVKMNGGDVKAKVFKKLVGKGEYESLAVDKRNKRLIVLCKNCKGDRKEHISTGYMLRYSNKGEVEFEQKFAIDLKKVRELDTKFPRTFSPSAMTMMTETGEWYILSSIDKTILITDEMFNPIKLLSFSRKMYEQPEGIYFNSKGDLLISSEIGDSHAAMLYLIKKK